MLLSLIIPCYNEAANLPLLLERCKNLTIASNIEVILVNNFQNYSWGLAGFGFGYSPFWNNYYANPYRFGYGGFYSPFLNLPYWNISS